MIANTNVDVIARPVEAIPPPGTEHLVDRIEMRVGGAGGITALALAALGIKPRLIACIGGDLLGSLVREELRAGGVPVDDVTVMTEMGTAVSIAMEAPVHDRSFLISLACLALFGEGAVPEGALHANAVMVGGYFLAPRLRAVPTNGLLRTAKESGARTFFDTGWDPDGWRPSTRSEIRSLLPLVDVFLPNLDEAIAISGSRDAEAAARTLQRISGGAVVVKLGAGGCIALASDASVIRRAAPKVDLVDSTGGGDAFNAGLIAGLADGANLTEAVDMAVRVGTAVVSRPSSNRYPRREELG